MKKITSVGLATILSLVLATGSVQASVGSTTPESMPAMFAQLDATLVSDAALEEVQGEGDLWKLILRRLPYVGAALTAWELYDLITSNVSSSQLKKLKDVEMRETPQCVQINIILPGGNQTINYYK